MNQDSDHHAPNVEQSWIVLDDQGWPSSRPPTASPTRPVPRLSPFREDEEDDDDDSVEQHALRRLGMDRDVREALELAERSLELAGSAEEFALQHLKAPDDDGTSFRSSPLNNYVTRQVQHRPDDLDDPYNGRGPPTVKRVFGVSPDSETIGFRNIKVVNTLSEAQVPQSSTPGPEDVRSSKRTIIPAEIESDDSDEGFLQWMFGLQQNASVLPLVISHSITLIAGLYLGLRRASSVAGSTTSTSSNVSNVGHQ